PPLRERFGIFHHLDFYDPEQLKLIVQRSAGVLDVQIDARGAMEIACRARGTPRVANRLLRRARDYAEVKGDGNITREAADTALDGLGVDEEGLDPQDRKYLHTIMDYYTGGPVGVEAVAATLNLEVDTLTDVVEPFLLKIGFVTRTRQGRCATARAYEHLGVPPPASTEPQPPLPLDEDA
ncbi:MAG: Holliday junction DNA helicase RuvB C-terminal domain-containing protein, partial [Armatimonadota bacterium]